jgi:hypothetical protein
VRLRLIVGRRARRLNLTCEPADELLLLENRESLTVILDLHGGYQLAIIDGTGRGSLVLGGLSSRPLICLTLDGAKATGEERTGMHVEFVTSSRRALARCS